MVTVVLLLLLRVSGEHLFEKLELGGCKREEDENKREKKGTEEMHFDI